MEILDNTVMITVPGAMDAGLGSLLFWGSLAFSLVVALLLTTPVNRWMISRGKATPPSTRTTTTDPSVAGGLPRPPGRPESLPRTARRSPTENCSAE